MAWYGRDDLAVDDPTGRGPVTMADRDSHAAILGILSERRPGEPVRSEEARSETGVVGARRLWVVDPLDGTREFIDRIPEFSVMVGLAEDGTAVAGVVYQPVQDRLYLGAPGVGAWLVEKAEVRPLDATGPVPRKPRFVRSRSHPDPRLEEIESALGEIEVILSGSVGTKCALLAEARADLYIHPVPYMREWDTCAPEAVLRAAGGTVTDCDGGRLAYGKEDPAQPRGLLAARPEVAARASEAVARVRIPGKGP